MADITIEDLIKQINEVPKVLEKEFINVVESQAETLKQETEDLAETYPDPERQIISRVSQGWKSERDAEGITLGNTDPNAHLVETGSRGGIKIRPHALLERSLSKIESEYE